MKRKLLAAMLLMGGVVAVSAQSLGVYTAKSSKVWDISSLQDKTIPLQSGSLKVGSTIFPTNEVDSVVVRSLEAPQLTEAQQALLKGYKEQLGIDLTKVLGVKKLHARLFLPGSDMYQAFAQPSEYNLEDYTIITLSEASTAEQPVLKMTYNPLGLTNYQRQLLYLLTVGNDEFWYGETAGPNYSTVMSVVEWDKEHFGDFNVTLDGLTFQNVKSGENADISFITDVKNALGETVKRIPFQYYFSTWNKAQQIVAEQKHERWEELAEIINADQDGSPKTSLYLNTASPVDDAFDAPDKFIAPKATVDFKTGKLHFEFSFAAGELDYTRCYVDYE